MAHQQVGSMAERVQSRKVQLGVQAKAWERHPVDLELDAEKPASLSHQ